MADGSSSTEFDWTLCLGHDRIIKELKLCLLSRESLICGTPTRAGTRLPLAQALFWRHCRLLSEWGQDTHREYPETRGEAGHVGMQQQSSAPIYQVGSAGGGSPRLTLTSHLGSVGRHIWTTRTLTHRTQWEAIFLSSVAYSQITIPLRRLWGFEL